MTQQFHEGQEAEVWAFRPRSNKHPAPARYTWRKAKIVRDRSTAGHAADGYEVQFRDGTRAVFDTAHIRKGYDLDGSIAARSNILGTDT